MNKITIGSDPEFIIIDPSNEWVAAGNFIDSLKMVRCPDYTGRTISCENTCTANNPFCYTKDLSSGYRHTVSPQIGQDCGLGELRPLPGETPMEHLNNIQKLFNQINLPDGYKAYAGTIFSGMAMGGHIHIGAFKINTNDKLYETNYEIYVRLCERNRGLSNYLSYFCGIPLRKIEDKKDLKFRGLEPGVFGYYGSYDSKPYGLEWRMPASWLCDKKITLSALSLSYVCAQEFVKNPKYMAITNSAYKALVGGDISNIISSIEKMEYYKYYSKEIEPLLQMIANKETWDVHQNILEEWC